MKRFKQLFTVLLLTVALTLAGGQLYAQSNSSIKSYRQAYQMYQKAKKLIKNHKYQQAIAKLEGAIAVAKKGGGKKNAKLIELAKEKIPRLSLKLAINNFRDFQNSRSLDDLNKAISSFKNALDVGKKYGGQQVVQQAKKDIVQLLYVKSVMQYQKKNYEAALSTINKAIEHNENYGQAYYQRALIYKEIGGHLDKVLANFDKAIAVGSGSIVNKSKQNASGTLVYKGVQQLKNGDINQAINLLKKSLNYDDESADAYYRLAKAYSKLGQYSTALNYAKKGLNYAGSSRGDQAKFYYVVGIAYAGLNKKSSACEALSKAAYGKFKKSAKYKMKNMACQQ